MDGFSRDQQEYWFCDVAGKLRCAGITGVAENRTHSIVHEGISMSFLPASCRGLHKTVRRTVHVVVASAMTAGLWSGFCGGLPLAHAAERTVLAVVTCDSYADVKKQFGWLGTQVGQPGLAGMLESVLLMTTQGRGLAGLDVKRPLGAVLTTDGGDLGIHGYVPVRSLDKLLDSLQAVTGPTQQSGDARSLMLPNGIALDVVEKDGWAIVSPQGIDVEAVDPAPLFAPLSENYTLGIQLFPHLLPDSLRQQLRMLIEQGAAAAGEQGQQLDGRALSAALDSLGNTESLALGIAIDSEKDRLFIENRTVAVPGSPMAQAMEGSDRGQLTVPMPPAADGDRPAVRVHVVQSVPAASRQEAQIMLDQALPPDSNDPLTKTLAVLLRESLASVLASGGIDLAVSVDTTAAKKTALPSITAGLRVKDGAALENRVKQSFGGLNGAKKLLPPGVDVAFDSGKVGTTNLHTITVDLRGTDAAESLGNSLELTLAVTPEYAFLMAGGDPRQRLATVLGPAGKADPQAKPIVGVDVSVGRMLAYAAERGALPAGAVLTSQDDDGQQDGTIKVLVRPIERGVATRVSADGSAVRAMAARAGAGAANANGPAIPPGLPIPNGFPIPAPAR